MTSLTRRLRALTAVTALSALACVSTLAGFGAGLWAAPAAAQAQVPAQRPAAPPVTGEPSVRPGANAQYRQTEVDAWIKRFESSGREIYDQRDAILAASGVRPGLQVADVGAGTGLFAVLFGRAVAPGGKVYAIDIIPKFLAHLDRQLARKKIRNVVTRLGDERSIPLPANSVDLIFLCDAYHHFEYPRSMNASMWKALRPGGTLLLIDFKRVPGTTPQWIIDHVRADQDVFAVELQAAGFVRGETLPLLSENYVIRFHKPAAAAPSP